MTAQMTNPAHLKARKQMRGFVLAWTFITLVMGLATFLAIYFAYNFANEPSDDDFVGLSQNQDTVLVLPSITPAPVTPTQAPQVVVLPTTTPEQQPVVVAQAAPTETVPPEPPTATPTLLPAVDTRFEAGIQVQFSLDYNPDNQRGLYRSVSQDLGLPWIKQQVAWEAYEPVKGEYNWAITDLTLPIAQEFGIKVLLSVVAAPDWAREPGVDLSRHGPPANNQDFVDFIVAMLRRYPDQIHALEIWNEMNLDREWTSTRGLSAANYVAMLRDVHTAVKAIDPGIIIVSGALSPTGVDDGVNVINDFRFTDMLIQAGVLNYSDCYGAHHNGINVGPSFRYDAIPNDPTARFRGPFDNPHHSWSFRSTLEGYANRIAAAGRSTPLCVTEFGWAVAEDLEGAPPGFEFAYDNTLAEQAQWLPEALGNMEEWGFVRLAIIWNFNYAPQAGYSPDNDNVPYSLIGPGYRFRPAYDAVREWYRAYRERMPQS